MAKKRNERRDSEREEKMARDVAVVARRACERADATGERARAHNCSAMFDKLPVGPFCAAAIFYLPVKCICASARTVGTGNGEKMPQKRPYLVRDFRVLFSLRPSLSHELVFTCSHARTRDSLAFFARRIFFSSPQQRFSFAIDGVS